MRRGAAVLWALLLALLTLSPAGAAERPAWVKSIPDAQTFSLYARDVLGDETGKFVIDVHTGEVLFFDVGLYPLHVDFVFKALLHRPQTRAEVVAYHANYGAEKPDFILGYLTHHRGDDTWDYSFWENDRIQPADIRRVKARLDATFFRQDLPWRPESTRQEALLPQLKDLPTVTSDERYKGQGFQALNEGSAVGILRIVPAGTPWEALDFARGDIPLLQESYPDLSPVAGVLSTTFSTPLSHVNLRARAWGVPNGSLRGADLAFADLDGLPVHLTVAATGVALRPATPAEIDARLGRDAAPRIAAVPRADLTTTELRPLLGLRAGDAPTCGAKAANLGEALHARAEGVNIPGGFCIPFAWYQAHLDRSGLQTQLDALRADPRMEDPAFRREALSAFRAEIEAAPLDPALLEAVWQRVTTWHPGEGMFVRSSTNAEDLAGFNGAGLYETVPNVRDAAAMEAAIKHVWASLWNLRAVEERALWGIDDRQVYAAILVQRGVSATAAGVLVTANLYDPQDDHSYTINAKRGLGMKVVGGQVVPEQVVYDVRYPGARVISRSDEATMLVFDPAGGIREVPTDPGTPVLTEDNARRIAKAAQALVPAFPTDNALDIEWVLEGEALWIVQVRPFIGG